jgi:hypothetical protein
MENGLIFPYRSVKRLTLRGDAGVKELSGGGFPMQGGRRFRGIKDLVKPRTDAEGDFGPRKESVIIPPRKASWGSAWTDRTSNGHT